MIAAAVTRFVDMMQGGPTRRRLSSGIILSGDVLGVIGSFVAVYISARGIKPQELWVVIVGAILAVLIAFSKGFKFYVDKREKEIKSALEKEKADALAGIKESYDLGSDDGAIQVFKSWLEVARLHEDGMENLSRQFSTGIIFQSTQSVSPDAIDSYLQAIANVFKAYYTPEEGVFTVSLAVVNSSKTHLWLTRIHPGGLRRSTPLPRDYPLSDKSWGMAECFTHDRIVSTRDVRVVGRLGDRGYLSVVNMPVKDVSGHVIGVVNVDRPETDAFGEQESVYEVWQYCLPLLSSIAMALSDPRLFRSVRQ